MARVRAVLAAVWTATRRGQRSLTSFSGNNLFYAGLTLLFMMDIPAFVFLLVLIGLVLFFPLSSDPLRKVPPQRFALWPLSRSERGALMMLAPWLNPLTWLLAILLVWNRVSIGFWALVVSLFALGFLGPSVPVWRSVNIGLWLPGFPGPLNLLIRKNLREALSTLDFYAGLIIVLPALFFRVRGLLPAEALTPLTMVVMLAISTHAQSLFGLDGEGGLTRYRLLPVAGWQILVAKDAAFLLMALLLTLPLSPLAGLAAALVALAVGHRSSVSNQDGQARWRFQTGASFAGALSQMIPMILAGAGAVHASPLILAPCVAAYAWSTFHFGRVLERS